MTGRSHCTGSFSQGTSEDADLHLSIAHALKTLGRRDEAIESYRRAAAARPNFGDAYWSLANLKTYRFTDEELTRHACRAGRRRRIGLIDRYHLCFALGKALEDQGEFAESFHYYELGNALKRSESRYRPEIIENNTRRQIEVCTAEFFAHRRGWGAQNSGSHLHRRAAAIGLDADRADPRLALAGRGHAGAGQHPADRQHAAGPRPRSEQSALPAHPGRPERRGFPRARRAIPRRHAGLSHRQAAASSTRCRTTSGTSGSST